jgi:YD repeat-containing protein
MASPSPGESHSCSDDSPDRADSATSFYTTTYTYDADGRLTSAMDCGGQVTRYDYSADAT